MGIRAQGLTVELPDHPLPAYADVARLVQDVISPLSKACRYSLRGGHMRLRV